MCRLQQVLVPVSKSIKDSLLKDSLLKDSLLKDSLRRRSALEAYSKR
jgi:hypothetical protein